MSKLPRPLLAGIASAGVAAVGFVVIAVAALGEDHFFGLDRTIALDMKAASADQPIMRPLMIVLTYSGGVAAMMILATFGVAWEGWRGRGKWRVAIGWAVIAVTGAALNLAVKTSLQRQRPPVEWRDPVVHENNESFPSGHAMGGTIGIGLLGYSLYQKDRRKRTNILIVVVLSTWVALVGFSRFYLRAHWFSDVLGGFALGLAWLSLGLGMLETWRRQNVQPRVEGSPSARG